MALNTCNSVGQITGTLINGNVTLSRTGYTLIYSNNPETVPSGSLADSGYYLYQDTSPGRTRAFFHHQNGTSNNMKVRVVVTNPNASSVSLYASHLGSYVSANVVTAGSNAWYNWLTQPINGYTPGTDVFMATVSAGASYVLLETAAVAANYVAAGVTDFVATSTGGGAAVPLKVTVYAYQSTVAGSLTYAPLNPSVQDLKGTTAVPGDSCLTGGDLYFNYGDYCFGAAIRGTFAHCSRTATINLDPTTSSQYLQLFSRFSNSAAMTGEYEAGTDVTTGKTVYLSGNYGVDYTLTFNLTDGSASTYYGYLQNPNASGQAYIIKEDGTVRLCSNYGNTQAWNFDTSSSGGQKQIWITLPGGGTGRVQLFWAP